MSSRECLYALLGESVGVPVRARTQDAPSTYPSQIAPAVCLRLQRCIQQHDAQVCEGEVRTPADCTVPDTEKVSRGGGSSLLGMRDTSSPNLQADHAMKRKHKQSSVRLLRDVAKLQCTLKAHCALDLASCCTDANSKQTAA